MQYVSIYSNFLEHTPFLKLCHRSMERKRERVVERKGGILMEKNNRKGKIVKKFWKERVMEKEIEGIKEGKE